MKLHPRLEITTDAENEIRGEVIKITEKYSLTAIEVIRIMLFITNRYSTTALRIERHGTVVKKADEE